MFYRPYTPLICKEGDDMINYYVAGKYVTSEFYIEIAFYIEIIFKFGYINLIPSIKKRWGIKQVVYFLTRI